MEYPRNNALSLVDGPEEIENPHNDEHVPVMLLLDVSGSMAKYKNDMTKAVKKLYNKIKEDDDLKYIVDFCVIRFNDMVDEGDMRTGFLQILDHNLGERMEKFSLTCEYTTHFGKALHLALKKFGVYKAEIKDNGDKLFRFVLVLVTDGTSDYAGDEEVAKADQDLENEAIKEIKKQVKSNELLVTIAEVGNECDHKELRRIAGYDKNDEAADEFIKNIDSAEELVEFICVTTSKAIIDSASAG